MSCQKRPCLGLLPRTRCLPLSQTTTFPCPKQRHSSLGTMSYQRQPLHSLLNPTPRVSCQAHQATVKHATLTCFAQEYFLIALSQPRQEEESSCSSSSEESEGEAPDAAGGPDSPAVRMMRKSMMFQQGQKQIREEAITQKRHTFRLPVGQRPPRHHAVA